VGLETKTDTEIETWIRNHEKGSRTSDPLYLRLLEERVQRAQLKHQLDFGRSLQKLKQAAVDQICISYGDLAAASDVEWAKARHQMNGSNGHLDRLLDVCHARGLPLLTAICVNQANVADGELGKEALAGFAAGARRLGIPFSNSLEFHHRCRDECWAWGRRNNGTDRDQEGE
jgi:hypothetical protein